LIAGRWIGSTASGTLASAIDGSSVALTPAEAIDFAEAVHHAHRVGVPGLLKLDFQQRAARLKALASHLLAHKEALYTLSRHTGATRADSWVDIEGGTGTLFAYASIGAAELPSGNVVHEGPVVPLGKAGRFAGTHILVPRGGLAVHINAFNFPVWGLLEKFAPSFLAGLPCIAKPATATSYLTEALVRLMHDSGLLPPGSLQLVIGGTGSADTAARLRVHPNLVAR
jgi:oxepin-CoA hydrolase/3-oxo-5,6-dehydrosuberyl-CoA semialdehyde dehydrogenase